MQKLGLQKPVKKPPCHVTGLSDRSMVNGNSCDCSLSAVVNRHDPLSLPSVPPKRDRELNLFARVRRVAGRKDGSFGVGVEYDSLDWFEQKTLADCLRGIPPRFPGETRHESGIQPVA